MRRGLLAAALLSAGCSPLPPAERPAPAGPPRLLATPEEIGQARRWMQAYPWYKAYVEEMARDVAPLLEGPVYISPRKWHFAAKANLCPRDETPLAYAWDSPHAHRCPTCGEVQRGGKYDDDWAGWHHRKLSERTMKAGALYQLTGDPRYALAVHQIVTTYARTYRNYPDTDNILGPARVLCGTHLECGWGRGLILGYDLTNAHPVYTDADRALIRRELFYPLAENAQRFDETVSNRQVWYNNLVASVGFLYGDVDLIRTALEGPRGFRYQLTVGVPEDGVWYEGTGYHAFTFLGFVELAEMARRHGTDLYGKVLAGHSIRSMLDGLMAYVKPDLTTPPIRDSGGVPILYAAENYEIGWLRYRDPRYAALLRAIYASRKPGEKPRSIPFFTLCDPELPDGPPFEPPGNSVLMEGNGIGVLRDRVGTDPRYACLDYGIVGGEHGQPERMALHAYALGRDWLTDPKNESYFLPNLQTWYRQSIAHNVLVVDETTQGWGNGRLRGFRSLPGLQWVSAETDQVYGGVRERRTLVSCGEYLLDLVAAESDAARRWDLPYHSFGTLAVDGPAGAPAPPFSAPGYAELTEIRSAPAEGPWQADFRTGDGKGLRVTSPEGLGERFSCLSPGEGGHYAEKRPMLMLRQEGRTARFIHLIHPFEGQPSVSAFRGEGEGRYRLRSGGEEHRLLMDPEGLRFSVLRLRDGRPLSAALTGLARLEVDGRPLVEAPWPLEDGASVRWEGDLLEVAAAGQFGRLRILAPGAVRLRLNGAEGPVERDGDVVVVEPPGPLAVHVPGAPQDHLLLFKGLDNPLRLWARAGAGEWKGRLSLRPGEDWREEARRQRLDWGGIVNLKAENRGPNQRVVTPLRRLEETPIGDWLDGARTPLLAIGAGVQAEAVLPVRPPSDLPEAVLSARLEGPGVSIPRRIRLADPLALALSFPNGERTRLRASLENRTPWPLKAALGFDLGRHWTSPGPLRRDLDLAPGESRDVEIPVALAGYDPLRQEYPVSASVSCGGFSRTVRYDVWAAEAAPLGAPPRLGERLEGFEGARPLRIGGNEQRARLLMGSGSWGGERDFLAKARLGYDAGHLYLGLEVSDDAVVPDLGPTHLYTSDVDSAVVTLDLRSGGAQQRDPRTLGCSRHIAVPAIPEVTYDATTRGDIPLLFAQIPGARTQWKRTADGYLMLVTMPLASLPQLKAVPGAKAGFDLALNDNDGGYFRKNQFIWAGYSENQSWADLRWIGMLLFR